MSPNTLFLLCFYLVLLPLSAEAAQFRWEPQHKGNYDSVSTLFADGPIEVGDYQKLLKALNGNQGEKGIPLYLQLNSNGGSFDEALRISKIARTKFPTTKLARIPLVCLRMQLFLCLG
jgi:hypothetical protein